MLALIQRPSRIGRLAKQYTSSPVALLVVRGGARAAPQVQTAKLSGMKNLLVAIALVAASVHAQEARLSPNAPKDKPVQAAGTKMEQAEAPFVERAKKTWPGAKKRYLAGLPKGEILFVTVKLWEGLQMEQCFVRVQKISGGQIIGTLATELMALKKVHNGDALTIKETELIDWMIAKPDGSEEGNVVGKFLDTWQP